MGHGQHEAVKTSFIGQQILGVRMYLHTEIFTGNLRTGCLVQIKEHFIQT
jgi:hypothetical protein